MSGHGDDENAPLIYSDHAAVDTNEATLDTSTARDVRDEWKLSHCMSGKKTVYYHYSVVNGDHTSNKPYEVRVGWTEDLNGQPSLPDMNSVGETAHGDQRTNRHRHRQLGHRLLV